MQIWLGLCR